MTIQMHDRARRFRGAARRLARRGHRVDFLPYRSLSLLSCVSFQTSVLDLKEKASSLASSTLKKDSRLKSLEIGLEQKREECVKLEKQLKKVSRTIGLSRWNETRMSFIRNSASTEMMGNEEVYILKAWGLDGAVCMYSSKFGRRLRRHVDHSRCTEWM